MSENSHRKKKHRRDESPDERSEKKRRKHKHQSSDEDDVKLVQEGQEEVIEIHGSSSEDDNDSQSQEKSKHRHKKKHKHKKMRENSPVETKVVRYVKRERDEEHHRYRESTSVKNEKTRRTEKEVSRDHREDRKDRHKELKKERSSDLDRRRERSEESHRKSKENRESYRKDKYKDRKKDNRRENITNDNVRVKQERDDSPDRGRARIKEENGDQSRVKVERRDGSRDRGRNRHGRSGGPSRRRNNDDDDDGEREWGRPSETNVKTEPKEKEKPNFGLSGKLTEDRNTFNGVVIKYSEPPEARIPKKRWRLYQFKGDQTLPTLYVHRQSAYLIGRDRKVADLPVDHPSCSKQHAAFQYRLVTYEKPNGTMGKQIRPYVIDLESANGTFINGKKIEPKKYVELLEKDVIKFGFSSREYVLLHEHSKDDELSDDE